MPFSLICVRADGDQLVCHGYQRSDHVMQEMKDRIKMGVAHPNMSYSRFILIGSTRDANGVHVYDADGNAIFERLLP